MTNGVIRISRFEQIVSWAIRQGQAHIGLSIDARITKLGVEFDMRMRDGKNRVWSCSHIVPYIDLTDDFIPGWPALESLLNKMLADVLEKTKALA